MLPLAFALFVFAAPGAPEAPRAQLSVVRQVGAEGCADGEVLAQRVREIAGAPVLTTSLAAPVRVDVVIVREPSYYEATLSVSGEQRGFRRLRDAGVECRGLDEAIAVTVAMLLDPQAQAESAEIAAVSPPPSRPPEVTPARAVRAPEPSDTVHLRAELSAGMGMALLDKPVAQAGLGVGLANRRFELTLGAKALQADRVSDGRGYADLQLYFAYLRACATIAGTRQVLALDLCGGPMVGVLSGAGNGYDRDLNEQMSWLAGAVGARLEATVVSPISWHLSVLAIAPLARRSLSVMQAGESHELFHTRNLGAIAELGLTVSL
jgi:hypothetical protein